MQKVEINFPSRLKDLRGGKTQLAIAKDLQVNQQTYARWELGDRQPKLQDLASIALHFGVTTDWLLGLTIGEGPRITANHSAVSIHGDASNRDCSRCEMMKAALKMMQKKTRRLA